MCRLDLDIYSTVQHSSKKQAIGSIYSISASQWIIDQGLLGLADPENAVYSEISMNEHNILSFNIKQLTN